MVNKKGFVLLETLIVTVFIVAIFTFIYVSVVPLLGIYENMATKNDIDIVYDLNHIRNMLYREENYNDLYSSNGYGYLTCNNLTNSNYCNTLINYLGYKPNRYKIFYIFTQNVDMNNFLSDNTISENIKDYISSWNINYNNDINYNNIITLWDMDTDAIVSIGLPINLSDPYVYY